LKTTIALLKSSSFKGRLCS